jgi:hypothetical protein
MKVTLREAMDLAPTDVAKDRAQWGDELYDKAVEHHTAKRLTADTQKGSTRNRDGFASQYVSYDWSERYVANPDHIYFDFFKGSVCNSCSRMQRGLNP